MTNLANCPREIRDCIYSAYFTGELGDNQRTRLHTLPLLRTSRSTAIEAIQAAKPVLVHAIKTTEAKLSDVLEKKLLIENTTTSTGMLAKYTKNNYWVQRIWAAAQRCIGLSERLSRQEDVAEKLQLMLEELVGEAAASRL